ncbi:hypothetical protein F3Y22_tig00111098pilonHSYRG00022 [Hibiscus syriacus]|uniref:Uncharacterized protein n=1 Tax=Hibiscus syriacus TaxID=106335 RepID=A0A6A2Z2S1_HIBSY|nr:hypothetical protein F3Y22_tig00111098pilonHSYRG00022 [Hibiscus syriacus]
MPRASDPIRPDESRVERLLGNLGVCFVRLEKGFDLGETAGLGEAADGEVLSVAGRRRGRVVFGNGSVDFEALSGSYSVWNLFLAWETEMEDDDREQGGFSRAAAAVRLVSPSVSSRLAVRLVSPSVSSRLVVVVIRVFDTSAQILSF